MRRLVVLLIYLATGNPARAEPRSLRLEDLTWPEVRQALAAGWTRILIPVGSTEQHGTAISLSSDSLQGDALGQRVSELLGRTLLAPTIRIGVSPHHMGFPGTLTVRPEILTELLLDQARSLARHGFQTVLLLPTHGGNFPVVAEVSRRAASEVPGARVLGFSDARAYLEAMRTVTERLGIPKEIAGAHAGQMEASIVLAIDSGAVILSKAEAGYTGDPDRLPERATSHGYHTITANGSIGDPRGATAEKGRAYLAAMAEAVSREFRRQMEPGGAERLRP